MSGAAPAAQLALRVAALAVLASAIVAVASTPGVRWQADATKTRAYTLSDQTLRLLGSLQGAWSVTVIVAEDGVDPALVRQIDEVLRRVRDSGPVTVERIDPTDPRSLGRWVEFLEAMQTQWADRAEPFRERLDQAVASHRRLGEFAAAQQATLERLAMFASETRPDERDGPRDGSRDGIVDALDTSRATFGQLSLQLEHFLDQVAELRESSPARPIPDDESARALLHASLRHWSEQAHALARTLDRLAGTASDGGVRTLARTVSESSDRMAVELRQAQDRLARLPALGLSDLARAVAEGETAIVTGPPGSAAIPSWQLLPRLAAGERGEGVRFDRRFRGEQVIAATIRSLLEAPPVVTFVHAEDRSLLRSTPDGGDLHAAADALRAARLDVREWSVLDPTPPATAPGRTSVWIVLPPMARRGVETSPAERLLLERTRGLVDRGEPTLITIGRSLLPSFRQRDPWSALCVELGVEADTGRVVLELDRTGTGRGAVRAWQTVERGGGDHPLATVIDGLATTLPHPLPLRPIDGESSRHRAWPVLAIEPASTRWLESDWRQESQQRATVPSSPLREPVPVALAIERTGFGAAAPTRTMVVGSGGWLLSAAVGASESLGGGRLALTSPGNRELLLASVMWLAGLDDLVVPGPSGREVPRLGGLDATTRTLWSALAIVALPATTLVVGGLFSLRRRRP